MTLICWAKSNIKGESLEYNNAESKGKSKNSGNYLFGCFSIKKEAAFTNNLF